MAQPDVLSQGRPPPQFSAFQCLPDAAEEKMWSTKILRNGRSLAKKGPPTLQVVAPYLPET